MYPSEQHYSVKEVAAHLSISSDTVRRIFLSEPGVIVISNRKPRKRVYRSLRIPESVERRVFARFTNGGRL